MAAIDILKTFIGQTRMFILGNTFVYLPNSLSSRFPKLKWLVKRQVGTRGAISQIAAGTGL